MSGLKIHEDDLKLLYEEDTKQLEGLPSPLKPAPAASTPTPSTSASSSNRDSDTLDKVNTFMDNAIVQLITWFWYFFRMMRTPNAYKRRI